MVNAQEWLEWKYPNKEEVEEIKHEIHEWVCGVLRIENFPNLKILNLDSSNSCYGDFWQLTKLEIINCPELTKLICNNNLLTYLDLSENTKLNHIYCENNRLNAIVLPHNFKNLTLLDLSNNDFKTDLSFLTNYRNLKYLFLGNNWEYAIRNGFYNYFYGSLIYLRNMKELTVLDLENTFINQGVEYLSLKKLRGINCSVNLIPQATVKEIYNICGEEILEGALINIYWELEKTNWNNYWIPRKEIVGFNKEKLRIFQFSHQFLTKTEEELKLLLADKKWELAEEREINFRLSMEIAQLKQQLNNL